MARVTRYDAIHFEKIFLSSRACEWQDDNCIFTAEKCPRIKESLLFFFFFFCVYLHCNNYSLWEELESIGIIKKLHELSPSRTLQPDPSTINATLHFCNSLNCQTLCLRVTERRSRERKFRRIRTILPRRCVFHLDFVILLKIFKNRRVAFGRFMIAQRVTKPFPLPLRHSRWSFVHFFFFFLYSFFLVNRLASVCWCGK